MPELAAAVFAGETTLVVVDQHVVVEAVLTRERRMADQANKRLDTCNFHVKHEIRGDLFDSSRNRGFIQCCNLNTVLA